MLTAEPSDQIQASDTAVPEMESVLRSKYERALLMIRGFGNVMVAFSGGIDSTLVAYLARIAVGKNVIAVTADSPSLSASELEEAKHVAKQIEVKHMVIRTQELDDPRYASNPTNRCYFCKKELSEKLKQLASDLGISTILDGTNADDLLGHRPGAAAMAEEAVRRPLAEVGFTKAEVRELARLLGLPNFDKASMPCLSSRIQYGQVITPERLHRVERSERFIRSLIGVKELRVRDHGNLARIEVGRNERDLFFNEEVLDTIGNALREFGFLYICFDLFGYRTGNMNQTLTSPPNSKSESIEGVQA